MRLNAEKSFTLQPTVREEAKRADQKVIRTIKRRNEMDENDEFNEAKTNEPKDGEIKNTNRGVEKKQLCKNVNEKGGIET